jgi:predicted ferric reductase
LSNNTLLPRFQRISKLLFALIKIFTLVKDEAALDWKTDLLGFMTPVLLAASISTLLLTSAILPARRLSWVNKLFGNLRRFRIMDAEYGASIYKKNQFGVGQPDFNLMSFWLIFVPLVINFFVGSKQYLAYAVDEMGARVTQTAVLYVSIAAGIAGTVCLSFFLVPVSRHSVLLVAMNWSPVHALRIHIWAGYLAYFFFFLHGIMIVAMWFKWAPGKVYEEFIPPKECWTGDLPEGSYCSWQWYNLTGLVAFFFYTVLWLSSFNWFRRKWYRLFYILHVAFGSLAILASIWHFEFIALYIIPSILYYLASTMPTLVQALASRFRGGVQISKVVMLDDAGDCVEVHISMDPSAEANLSNSHPSKFIRLCAPGISAVWHPFTVYNHPNDPTSMRMMIRPIGPFTKKLRSSLVAVDKRTVTLIDGFYRGNDHCQQALMMHDHVSIVAGGVALTPFLSMMFAILRELAMKRSVTGASEVSKDQAVLRSMTLIWSCRELGLLSYIRQNYLEDILRLAGEIQDFEFNVVVHFTGTGIEEFPNKVPKAYEEEECLTESIHNSDDDLKKDVSTQSDETPVLELENMKENHQVITHTVESSGDSNKSSGHAMELGRMMPARFSRMIWNVPYFVVFTSSVWLGFHFLFYPYDYAPSFRDLSEETYITILVILFFFGVGCVIELSVLIFRKHWPAPKSSDIAVVSSSKKELDMDMEKSVKFSSTIKYNVGRPSPDDLLADASRASAPGIFVCGPVGMVQSLRAAAAIENSPFGLLTRYAIYEESFEM